MTSYLDKLNADEIPLKKGESGEAGAVSSNNVRESVNDIVGTEKERPRKILMSDKDLKKYVPQHLLIELGYVVEGDNFIKKGKPIISSAPPPKKIPKINPEVYKGDLTFAEYRTLGYIPRLIVGNLNFGDCVDANEFILPEITQGNVDLSGLTLEQGLVFSNKEITGKINLSGLNEMEIEKLKKRQKNLVNATLEKGIYILKDMPTKKTEEGRPNLLRSFMNLTHRLISKEKD